MDDLETMDETRFDQLLAAFGADQARWPDAERALALRHLAANPAAHARRAESKALDVALDAWTLDAPSAALAERIAAGAPVGRSLPARAVWLSGVGLAAACALGVLVGAQLSAAPQATSADHDDPAVTAALDGNTEFTPSLDEASS
jgi:hypothetical protein